MSVKIRPLHDRVVVRRMEEEEKSSGGIILPGTAAEKPDQGEVLAVGPGKCTDTGIREMAVRVGDIVLFGKYAGNEVKIKDQELVVMREDDIMGVVEA